jgi:hypothetical protein
MNNTIRAMVLALVLVPGLAFSDVEVRGTVLKVDQAANQLVVKTERGEETFILDKSTKGINNAKEGAKVIVKFTEKDGEPKVIEIVAQDDGTSDSAPH